MNESHKASPKLARYSMVGSYPLVYLDPHCNVLCADCATEARDNEGLVVTPDIYWEGDEMECDGACGTFIESAYGPVESD